MYDVPAIMRETRERETHMTDTKKITALELTIANLTGDVHTLTQAFHEMLEVLKPEKVAKTATAPKVTGTPAAPLYVKESKPQRMCDDPTCNRYRGLENAKPFSKDGAEFHVTRTKHKMVLVS